MLLNFLSIELLKLKKWSRNKAMYGVASFYAIAKRLYISIKA